MSKNDPQAVYLVGHPAVEVERFVQEFPPREIVDEEGEVYQVTPAMNNKGQELPDPVPMAPPVGYMQTPDLKDIIRDMLRHEKLNAELRAHGIETFDESEDFEIEDDAADPQTEYEAEFDPEWMKIKEAYAARMRGPVAWAEYCKKEGLTEDGRKFIRRDPRKEADDDGDTSDQQRRVDTDNRRPARVRKVDKDYSKSVDDAADEGSGGKAGSDD